MNVISLLKDREYSYANNQILKIRDSLENSFATGNFEMVNYPLPANVSSTMALCISPCGLFLASTHGDHTVKVFHYATNELIKELHGHPRTPWTVKYHSFDSNIIASGCLGFEVRVWDIENGTCTNMIRYDNAIISLSFHPLGQYIAIASGPYIRLWDWTKEANTKTKKHFKSSDQFQLPTNITRTFIHTRNIRAVFFHPLGSCLFIAAPDPPASMSISNNNTLISCRLYAINFADLFLPFTSADNISIDLNVAQTILPQIHLYADGGIDISKDGKYILTCAILLSPPPVPDPVPLPTVTYSYTQDHSMFNDITTISNSNGNGNGNGVTGIRDRLLQAFDLNAYAYGGLFNTGTDDINTNINISNHINGPNTTLSADANTQVHLHTETNTLPREGMNNVKQIPMLFDDQNNANPPIGWEMEDYICLFDVSDVTIGSISDYNSPIVYDDYNNHYITNPNPNPNMGELLDMEAVTESTTNISLQDTTMHLEFPYFPTASSINNNNNNSVKICQFRKLSKSLKKAITSTKLSSSCNYALLGFGVRDSLGRVQGHTHSNTTCEIVRLHNNTFDYSSSSTTICGYNDAEEDGGGIETVCLLVDRIDEVNIAHFHPDPGCGLVYGTKKGKVIAYNRK